MRRTRCPFLLPENKNPGAETPGERDIVCMSEKNSNPQSTPKSIPEQSFPFYVWSGLLAPEHRKRMGSAIWVYLWCLRRTTREKDGLGLVLGGSRIKQSRIARELGVTERTIGTDLARLRKHGYLQIRRIPYGLVITVFKSKRKLKRSEENFRSQIGRNLPNTDERSEETFRSRSEGIFRNNIEEAVKSKQKKRENSGSASPHRGGAHAREGNSEKKGKTYLAGVTYA